MQLTKAFRKEEQVRYEAHSGNSQKEVRTNEWDGVSPKAPRLIRQAADNE